MRKTRRRPGPTTRIEFYPGQTFELDGMKYRVVATDSRERIALEMTGDVSWGYEEAERNLSLLMNFCSQHGTTEEKAFAEKIYERWPHLRPAEIKEN
jgi:hypothetical protein